MLLAFGVVCGLLEASKSGRGQVIDAAMVDGAALLASMLHGFRGAGIWGERGTNLLDTGAFFYEVYETSDNRYVSFGSIEPQFYAQMLELTGLPDTQGGDLADQNDRTSWPTMKKRMAALVRTRTRDEWCQLLEGTDACFAPVLGPGEAPEHPHNVARQTFVEVDGVTQPAPAPRFSRSVPHIAGPPVRPGHDTDQALADWGFEQAEIQRLRNVGALR
jgi:alpha-methylacyl-CoA racemase